MGMIADSCKDYTKDVEQFLEPYREEAKKMDAYPLFLAIKDMDWTCDAIDGDEYRLRIPKDTNLMATASSIIGVVDGDYLLERSISTEIHYMAWLWNPWRRPVSDGESIMGHRYHGQDVEYTSSDLFQDVLRKMPRTILEPTPWMRTHPLWTLYLQIEHLHWHTVGPDDKGLSWLIPIPAQSIVHTHWSPVSGLLGLPDAPRILEWMDIHRHPILYLMS